MRRLLRSALVVFPMLLLPCCGQDSEVRPVGADCLETVPTPHGLWSEFLDPEEVIAQIPDLKRHAIGLYQNIPSVDIGDPGFASLFGEASCDGLEVRAWLTLPEEDGYWPNEKNV
ncbi:MAG: hypothetical protein ACWGSD_09000, partial [Thermodesulfobacteriota bacterium]